MMAQLFDISHSSIKFYKKIDLITIPSTLIDSLSCIENQKNLHPTAPTIYGTYEVSKNLEKFLQPYFKKDIIVRYQIIRHGLPIHKDSIDGNYKINYILDLGGNNVETRWYSEDKKTLLKRAVLKKNCWYVLNVKKFHDVVNVESTRLSITIK